jgi:hypothetical protein
MLKRNNLSVIIQRFKIQRLIYSIINLCYFLIIFESLNIESLNI